MKGGSSVPNTCPMTPGHTYTFNLRNLTPGTSIWREENHETKCTRLNVQDHLFFKETSGIFINCHTFTYYAT